jgi:hypothetical protein
VRPYRLQQLLRQRIIDHRGGDVLAHQRRQRGGCFAGLNRA